MRFSAPFSGSGSAAGIAARLTAPFSALTRNRPKVARPSRAERDQRQRPSAAPDQDQVTRKAQLALARIEPWSVMKFSFLISIIGCAVLTIAVALLYTVLSKLGVFHSIENTVGLVTSTKNRAGANAASWFGASRVIGYTIVVGVVNVVLITALATVGAVVYNLVAMLVGGIEVTLRETD
ncbi:MAG: DUF3566 domain-containing protein [Streptosporangiaceae bacterium]|jgi:hypothetical protein